jgi:DNA-binding MarR family transcriptional regulator
MDQIKDAFQRVRQDMDSMKKEMDLLKQFFSENNEKLAEISKAIKEIQIGLSKLDVREPIKTPTDTPKIPAYPTHFPTDDSPFKGLKGQNMGISTGNEGVPTDKQTNKQTNQQTEKTSFGDALEILNSLDNIKKEIRNKFKRITDQEFLVFSTIYQMAEESDNVDYKSVSKRLNLTESSIRDYVGRLIKKGIPVEKTKINNKMIRLSISEKLKKITPLPVIFRLREL